MGIVNPIEVQGVLSSVVSVDITEEAHVVYLQQFGKGDRLGGVYSAIVPEMTRSHLTKYQCKLWEQFNSAPLSVFVGEMHFSRVRGLVVVTSYLFH